MQYAMYNMQYVICDMKLSKVSALVSLLYKITIELTFENFYVVEGHFFEVLLLWPHKQQCKRGHVIGGFHHVEELHIGGRRVGFESLHLHQRFTLVSFRQECTHRRHTSSPAPGVLRAEATTTDVCPFLSAN